MTSRIPHSHVPSLRPLHLVLAAAALGVAVTGCDLGQLGTSDIGSTADAPASFEEFQASVHKEPWQGGVYIVNGDETIPNDKKLREFYDMLYGPGQGLIVHQSGGVDAVWNSTQKQNLTYCISNDFGDLKAQVIEAMNAAAEAWESAAAIDFIHVEAQDATCNAANEAVVFDVGLVTGQPYLARAFFPDSRRSARNVLIDQSSFGNVGYTLAGILRHELGHTLGFRHEHTRPEAGTCFEDTNWRPLTPYDSASVMHYPQCNGTGTDLSLTALDIQGATALYGAPGQQPQPPRPGEPMQGQVTNMVTTGQQHIYDALPVVAGSQFVADVTGDGDADLYVRFNGVPSRAVYDCRPYLVSSNETCAMDVPEGATTAHLMIDGFAASTYTLSIQWVQPAGIP